MGWGAFFNLKDYRFLVTPLGLLIMIVSLTTYDSIMEMVAALPGFRYVAILAQIILPFCVLIALEIKLLIQKKEIQ